MKKKLNKILYNKTSLYLSLITITPIVVFIGGSFLLTGVIFGGMINAALGNKPEN